MTTNTSIPFPADLAALAPPGVLATYAALEVGAFYNLASFAWVQDVPCTIPHAAPSFLAAVARTTPEEWARVSPRVLLAFRPDGESLVCDAARKVYETLAARATAVTASKRAAGRAGADARWQRDGTCHAPAMHVPSSATAAPSVRSSESSALPLQRSSLQSSIRSAPEERGEEVIALVGAGARALLADRIQGWRREKARGMLEQAIAQWRTSGLTTYPLTSAARLAETEHADPARVEFLIQDADAKVLDGKGKGRTANPVGIVIAGLGESEKTRGRPCEVPMFLTQRWQSLEATTLKTLEATAAISARINAVRAAAAPTTQTGGHRA